MAWKIELDGETWRELDLTLGEAEKICQLTGTGWGQLSPLTSPAHLVAICAVFLARQGTPVAEALTKLRERNANEMLKTISVDEKPDDLPDEYVNGNPPVAADPTSTP